MTGSRTTKLPVGRAGAKRAKNAKQEKKKPVAPLQLSVALTGDPRLAENLIVEVLAAARRCGLEPPSVRVVRQPRVGPKVKLMAGRKPG
jgi:hypothetical protein